MKKLIDSNKIAIDYDFSGMSNYLIVTVKNSGDIVNDHLKILLEKKISCFLPVKKIQLNNSIQLYYDITNKATLSQFLKNDVFTKAGLIDLLNKIIDAIDEAQKVNLVDKCIILDRKYIFTETITSKPLFVYLPFYTESSGLSIIADFLNTLKEGNNLDFDHTEYFNLILSKCLDNKTTTQELKLLFANILKNTTSSNNLIIYRPQKKEEKVKSFDRYNTDLEQKPKTSKVTNIAQTKLEAKVIDIVPTKSEPIEINPVQIDAPRNIGDFLGIQEDKVEDKVEDKIIDKIIDKVEDKIIDIESPIKPNINDFIIDSIVDEPTYFEPNPVAEPKTIKPYTVSKNNDTKDTLSDLKMRLQAIDKGKSKPEKAPSNPLKITNNLREPVKKQNAVIKYPIVDLSDIDEEQSSKPDKFHLGNLEDDFINASPPSDRSHRQIVIDPFEDSKEITDDDSIESSIKKDYNSEEMNSEHNPFDNPMFTGDKHEDEEIDLSISSSRSFRVANDNKVEIVQLILCNFFIIVFFVIIAVLGKFNEFFFSQNTDSLNLPSIVVTSIIVIVLETFFIKRIFVDSNIEKPVREKPVKEKPVREKPVREKPVKEKPVKEKPVIEKPVREKPVREKPVIEKPVREKPSKLTELDNNIDKIEPPKSPYFGAILNENLKDKPPMLGGFNSISLDLDNDDQPNDPYVNYESDDLLELDQDNYYSEEILDHDIIDYEGEFNEKPSRIPTKKPSFNRDDEILPGIEISNSEKIKKDLTAKKSDQEFEPTETSFDDTEFVTETKVPFLVTEIGGAMQKIYITKDNFTLGRFVGKVDYVCQSNKVGKIHATIINRDGNYYINDLSSRNGTFINSYKQRSVSNIDYQIKDGDVVILADLEFTFHVE